MLYLIQTNALKCLWQNTFKCHKYTYGILYSLQTEFTLRLTICMMIIIIIK